MWEQYCHVGSAAPLVGHEGGSEGAGGVEGAAVGAEGGRVAEPRTHPCRGYQGRAGRGVELG